MHRIDIPENIRSRALRHRGREHVIDRIDPPRTAHIVVDLQNGFMGTPFDVPTAREIVPNVNLIVAALRHAGGANMFLRYTYDEAEPQPWTVWFDTYLGTEMSAVHRSAFARGAEGWQLWPTLDVQPSDLIIDKTRFSGFVPGTCRLDDELKTRGIDTLIVTGTLTNVCCESTARDAMQRNYKVVFVADGNAAVTDAEHNATLANMIAPFADVMTTAEIVGLIEAGMKHDAA
jgi:ureidoacrylate peracid hydrolase